MAASINISSLISQLAAAAGNATSGDKERNVGAVQMISKEGKGFDQLLARHSNDEPDHSAKIPTRSKKVNPKDDTNDAAAVEPQKQNDVLRPRNKGGDDDSRKVTLSDDSKEKLKDAVSRLNDAADTAQSNAKTPAQETAVKDFRQVLEKLAASAEEGTITVGDAKELLASLYQLSAAFPVDPNAAVQQFALQPKLPQLLNNLQNVLLPDEPALADVKPEEPRLIDYEGLMPVDTQPAVPQLPDTPCPTFVQPPADASAPAIAPTQGAEAAPQTKTAETTPAVQATAPEEEAQAPIADITYVKKAAAEKTADPTTTSDKDGNNLPRFAVAVDTTASAQAKDANVSQVTSNANDKAAFTAREVVQNLNYNNNGQQQQQSNQGQTQSSANTQVSLQTVGANDNRLDAPSFRNLLNNNATRESVMEQIVVHVKTAVKNGASEISIQLEPERLGKLNIKMNVGSDGKTHLSILADNADTLRMLKDDARALERILADSGLKADAGSLSFNLRGGEGQQSQSQPQKAYVSPLPDIQEEQFLHSVEQTYILTASDGGVDIKV